MRFSDSSYFVLLHPDGTVMWHPDASRIGQPCDPELFAKISHDNFEGDVYYDDGNGSNLVVNTISKENRHQRRGAGALR
jgi:hypothetical protein